MAVKNKHAVIEAVCPALKEYVCATYAISPARVTVACYDTPEVISAEQKTAWRVAVRDELVIAQDAYVYCYNGSIKAWQCPDAVLIFFAEKYKENRHAFLLILTQDVIEFKKLAQASLPMHSFFVCSVRHADMYKYLAACDAGLLFRAAHVVNWTSRPTKMLEYQALGLPIIHNNTIACLAAQK
jgi:hypothetical protein